MGVPTTMSSCAEKRASNTLKAASRVMNRVTPFSWLIRLRAALASWISSATLARPVRYALAVADDQWAALILANRCPTVASNKQADLRAHRPVTILVAILQSPRIEAAVPVMVNCGRL